MSEGRGVNDASLGLGLIDYGAGRSSDAKKTWAIGIIVIVATIIAVAAVCLLPTDEPKNQMRGQPGTLKGGAVTPNPRMGMMQQAAFPNAIPPRCAQCPNAPQCFPNTPVAQQVGFLNSMPPGCAQCPNVSQCFPNAPTGHLVASPQWQQAALPKSIAPPPIYRDAVAFHKYRGVCSNCHAIRPDVAIPANATLRHVFRGVCSNCHTITGTRAGAR